MKQFRQLIFRPGISKIFDESLLPTTPGQSIISNSMAVQLEPTTVSVELENEKRKHNNIRNFLKIYFDFAYYTGCSPFHFVRDPDNDGWFVIKTWKPHQVICFLLHSIGIFRIFTETRRIIAQTVRESPEHYFAIVGGIFRILFKVVTIKRFWFNQKQFLDILNFVTLEKSLPDCHMKMQNRYLVSFACGLCFVIPVVIALKSDIIASPSTWNTTWWNRHLVSDGRFAFFISSRTYNNHANDTTTITEIEDISTADYFLGLAMGIGLMERLLMGFYFDASLLCCVLTLWTSSRAFSKSLLTRSDDDGRLWANLRCIREKSNKGSSGLGGTGSGGAKKSGENWITIYESYKAIGTLSQLINQAFGSMITTFLGESILYHSMNMDAVMLTKDAFKQVYLTFFIASSSMTYLYAADICCQMDSLRMWLSKDEHRRHIPLDELNVVLHELQTTVIGIRGSNIFTITYALVWNMLTTVVTYFIICVQTRVNYSGNSDH